ncbi:MAG: peptide ABC transporter substrate-binding protein [Campylobacterales bacterium]|nr:peptide ABC transporter substrate-binding protein [Campylobacterales bacterium]
MRYILIFIFAIFLQASTLHLSMSSNPSRINPILATDSASGEIAGWIFNGLVKYDKDGNLTTDLAKSFYFEDNTTLVFELKENVYFHDGKKLTADDVIFTFELLKSPKIFTPYSQSFRFVKNIEKLSEFKFKVNYTRPYFKAVHIWNIGIVPKHILEKEQDLMTSKFNQNPIGTGAYKLTNLNISGDIELIANENYFEHKPNIEKIHYHFMPDDSTKFLTLKTKQLDIGTLTPLQYKRQIDDEFKKHFKIVQNREFAYTYLGFNLKDEKFKDKKVREALYLAIDRQEIIDILSFGVGELCHGPFMPDTFAYNEHHKPKPNDINRAKSLLKEAGFSEKNPLTFEIATNANNPIRVKVAEIMQYQLSKIGVKVKIKSIEWQAFLNTVIFPRNFEAVILGWGLGLIPDAYAIWHKDGIKKGGFNFIGYDNEVVNELIEKAEATIDQQQLSKIYKQIFETIIDDYPYIFLYIPHSITAVNSKITPIIPSLTGIMHNQIDWMKE